MPKTIPRQFLHLSACNIFPIESSQSRGEFGQFEYHLLSFLAVYIRLLSQVPPFSIIFPIKFVIHHSNYPLVNVYIAIENHHAINGKIHYKSPFSIATLNYQRAGLLWIVLLEVSPHFSTNAWSNQYPENFPRCADRKVIFLPRSRGDLL